MASFTFISENETFGSAAPASNAPPSVRESAPPPNNYRTNLRWGGEYIPPHQNSTLSARSTVAAVPISHLKITADQHRVIESMYNPGPTTSFPVPPIIDNTFQLDTDSQLRASGIMAQYGLDVDSREHIGNRWSQQWSRNSADAKVETRKILYLCACGYDHAQRNTKYDRTPDIHATPGTQERHTALPFTGCLAHAEITVRNDKIMNLMAKMEHVFQLPPPAPPMPVETPHPTPELVSSTTSRPSTPQCGDKRKILRISPEKAGKRHQSYGIH
ncbi:hypothetical protein FB451DRAFT_1398810 [Mycena latifolia]|nr:hypothetical protein FB451DRAFT_1398810 [Mycena latifolia]